MEKVSAQVVLINKEGLVLGVSRKHDHNDFGLPGGKMEWNDSSPMAAAIRETLEETGLHVTNLRLIFAIHKDGFMGYTYLADYEGEINHNEPHVVKWQPFSKLVEGSFGKYNKLVSESLTDMGVEYIYSNTTTIAFTGTRLPYGWMGNMSPYPINFGGEIYKTSEALFQALRFSDNEIKQLIREEKSPMGAKAIMNANSDKITTPKHSEMDVKNMGRCLRLKLIQHPFLEEALLNTGDALIVEDVTRRGDVGGNLFWGAMLVDGKWVGKNTLGNLWMDLRKELASK